MSKRRDGDRYLGGAQSSSTPKRIRKHVVSDSDPDDGSDNDSMSGQFMNQGAFLQNFGGYASDNDADDSDYDQGMNSK
jgi:hypothetical protein